MQAGAAELSYFPPCQNLLFGKFSSMCIIISSVYMGVHCDYDLFQLLNLGTIGLWQLLPIYLGMWHGFLKSPARIRARPLLAILAWMSP